MKNLIMSGILLLSASPALAQEAFSTLEEQMTGKEFMDSGLNKLTPEELAVLNDWLQAHSVATLDEAKRPLGTPGTAAGSTGPWTAPREPWAGVACRRAAWASARTSAAAPPWRRAAAGP